MVSLLVVVKLDTQRGGGFRNNYSVFLPDADLSQLATPMEKNNGFFVGSAGLQAAIENFEKQSAMRTRRTKIARKDDRGFVIEVSAPLIRGAQIFSTPFNFASIKFGLLVKE